MQKENEKSAEQRNMKNKNQSLKAELVHVAHIVCLAPGIFKAFSSSLHVAESGHSLHPAPYSGSRLLEVIIQFYNQRCSEEQINSGHV